jgi:hypothetical protein
MMQSTSPNLPRASKPLWVYPRDWTRERFSDAGLNVRVTVPVGGNGEGDGIRRS